LYLRHWDKWRGVMNRRETSWERYEQDRDKLGVLFTTQGPLAGCYEQAGEYLGVRWTG
jgi:hypothetical protein